MVTVRAIVKRALIRAYRVFVYSFVGVSGVANIEPVRSLADVKLVGTAWAFAAVTAASAALVAFLIATAEAVNGHLPGFPSNKGG